MRKSVIQLLACLLLVTACGNDKKKQENSEKDKVEKKISKENKYKETILEVINNDDIVYTGATGIKVIVLNGTVLLVKQETEITDEEMDETIFLNVHHFEKEQKRLNFNMIDMLGKDYLVDGVKFYVAELDYPFSEDISVVQVGQYSLEKKKAIWNIVVPKKKIQTNKFE
ncbi:hypothetical protein [Lacinutrix mariniflava]|uniref:hypothetical protein n=1 Tax=Lacinutrix mariniflava TaxID=342955 RepID=UPI000A6C5CAF|nr:hypothetical protein [Lacinutrix mariniflava]